MNAVILYDEFEAAVNAKMILRRVAYRPEVTLTRNLSPWSLDVLLFRPTAEMALREAASAHLIVLAVREPEALPAWVLNWLELWAKRRAVPEAAIAMLDGNALRWPQAALTAELAGFTERHRLNKLPCELRLEASHLNRFLHERLNLYVPTKAPAVP